MHAGSTVYMGERLNKLGNQYWESFATQNYFDPNGVFYTVLISGPLLLVNFIVLVSISSCTDEKSAHGTHCLIVSSSKSF